MSFASTQFQSPTYNNITSVGIINGNNLTNTGTINTNNLTVSGDASILNPVQIITNDGATSTGLIVENQNAGSSGTSINSINVLQGGYGAQYSGILTQGIGASFQISVGSNSTFDEVMGGDQTNLNISSTNLNTNNLNVSGTTTLNGELNLIDNPTLNFSNTTGVVSIDFNPTNSNLYFNNNDGAGFYFNQPLRFNIRNFVLEALNRGGSNILKRNSHPIPNEVNFFTFTIFQVSRSATSFITLKMASGQSINIPTNGFSDAANELVKQYVVNSRNAGFCAVLLHAQLIRDGVLPYDADWAAVVVANKALRNYLNKQLGLNLSQIPSKEDYGMGYLSEFDMYFNCSNHSKLVEILKKNGFKNVDTEIIQKLKAKKASLRSVVYRWRDTMFHLWDLEGNPTEMKEKAVENKSYKSPEDVQKELNNQKKSLIHSKTSSSTDEEENDEQGGRSEENNNLTNNVATNNSADYIAAINNLAADNAATNNLKNSSMDVVEEIQHGGNHHQKNFKAPKQIIKVKDDIQLYETHPDAVRQMIRHIFQPLYANLDPTMYQDVTIYDPCAGNRVFGQVFNEFGFTNVEERDLYTLKEKAFRSGKPFIMLLPTSCIHHKGVNKLIIKYGAIQIGIPRDAPKFLYNGNINYTEIREPAIISVPPAAVVSHGGSTETSLIASSNINNGESSKISIAIVSALVTNDHFKRDKDTISMWQCLSARTGIPFIVDTHELETSSFWNKQRVALKFLKHYEWILYVDTDTYFVNRHSVGILRNFVKDMNSKSVHFVLQETEKFGLDAGVFMVRNSPPGRKFLHDWLNYSYRSWINSDNGALYLYFLRYTIPAYNGSCDHFLFHEEYDDIGKSGAKFWPCFYDQFETNGIVESKINDMYILSTKSPLRMTAWFKRDPNTQFVYHNKDIAKQFGIADADDCDLLRKRP
eukprot:gene7400-10089_t